MDRFSQINQILDSCLTTEFLNQVYPPQKAELEKNLHEPEIKDQHRWVQIHLLELLGPKVQMELNRAMQGDEVALFCQRVDQFLIQKGFKIKSFF
jgi:hypothetical protein